VANWPHIEEFAGQIGQRFNEERCGKIEPVTTEG
jgi:hypothetical protein